MFLCLSVGVILTVCLSSKAFRHLKLIFLPLIVSFCLLSDGKALAVSRDCKFIETSSGIQHNVDELLVGILKQIRLRESRDRRQQQQRLNKGGRQLHSSKTSLSLNIAREILNKICMNDISKSKSCENLLVL